MNATGAVMGLCSLLGSKLWLLGASGGNVGLFWLSRGERGGGVLRLIGGNVRGKLVEENWSLFKMFWGKL